MTVIQNVLWLLVLIGVMILIHELGHFWAARYFDVRVEVFSFGFGPRLFGFRKGKPITVSRRCCSAAMSKWRASSRATKIRMIRAAFWRSRAGSA